MLKDAAKGPPTVDAGMVGSVTNPPVVLVADVDEKVGATAAALPAPRPRVARVTAAEAYVAGCDPLTLQS